MRASPLDLGAPPRVFMLDDGAGMTLAVMDIGATWLSCRVPLVDGSTREVLLGHAKPADHLREPGYLGAIVGRYANRIAGARFTLNGGEHRLTPNEGPHQLHGGPEGFNRRRWQVLQADARCLRLALTSPAGDQGFPGELDAEVEYRIDRPGALTVAITTETSQPCPVNLTSHAYFNLDEQHIDIRDQHLRIAASHYLPVQADLIPAGDAAPVQGTAFDWRRLRLIGQGLRADPRQPTAAGFDHCFVLDAACADGAAPAVELRSSDGQLEMSLATSYPGLQFYSGNQLALVRGRDGRSFAPHAGVALEPQYFPDSPNRPDWPQPSCIQQPGTPRRHVIRIRFANLR